ncbi:shikimate dehydrogenase family protein [Xenophilus sp.]|uniref:shikimate dehydrogenase family protein n=1 Tax=Xenophilus sp. TaxID=1873499 RepID=UPI0037DCA911
MADTDIRLSGATRVHFIVGDPIAQVKSPQGVTQAFQARGLQAVVVPAHVAPDDLADWLRGVSLAQNVDGVIVTVPHKFASAALCATLSERAAFLGAVNTLRRTAGGRWHGDMFDGLGCVQALRGHGCDPAGRRALLVGAGGAGTAIAHALVLAGVAQLAVHDGDAARRDALVGRLAGLGRCPVAAGSADPAGFDLVVNASPAGMREDDPLPVQAEGLAPGTFVACVVTQPAVTPLIAAARARGLDTSTGNDMFACVRDLMVDFLAEAAA